MRNGSRSGDHMETLLTGRVRTFTASRLTEPPRAHWRAWQGRGRLGLDRIAVILSFAALMVLWTQPAATAATVCHYPPTSACAITWPMGGDWIAHSSLDDSDDSLANAYLDFVGNGSYAGMYSFKNQDYLFFRIRLNAPVLAAVGDVDGSILILLNTDVDDDPEWGFAWDAQSFDQTKHGLEVSTLLTLGGTWDAVRMGDVDGLMGDKAAPPDFSSSPLATDGFVRSIDGQTSNIGGDADTFLDVAVSCSYLQNSSSTGLTCGASGSWMVQLASIENSNDHGFLRYDIAGGNAPSDAISGGWGGPVPVELFGLTVE